MNERPESWPLRVERTRPSLWEEAKHSVYLFLVLGGCSLIASVFVRSARLSVGLWFSGVLAIIAFLLRD